MLAGVLTEHINLQYMLHKMGTVILPNADAAQEKKRR